MIDRFVYNFKKIAERRAMRVIREDDRVERCEGNERRERRKEVDQFCEIYM